MPATIILKVSKNIGILLCVKIVIFNLLKMHIVTHRNKKTSVIFYLGLNQARATITVRLER